MARSQATSSKKEKEKKRKEKQKQKAIRKEERKANAQPTKNLEQMMAYVDENGNLSATPPDVTKKQVINAEDIEIGIPRGERVAADTSRRGTVTFFNTSKGYGFIKDDRTGESVFVHINALDAPIKENDKVTFMTERTPKGMSAINVHKA